MVTIIMRKSISVTAKKKRGRPATTGQGLQVGERWHPPEIAAIDAWIESQGGNLTRGHAIRRLVAIGLRAPPPKKVRPDTSMRDSDGRVIPPVPAVMPGRRSRAAELAAKQIEKMGDPAAPPEERDRRRRRLTKGPQEFRGDRVDQPKAKPR